MCYYTCQIPTSRSDESSRHEGVAGGLHQVDEREPALLARFAAHHEPVGGRQQNLALLREERVGVDVAATLVVATRSITHSTELAAAVPPDNKLRKGGWQRRWQHAST
jgi:hypothetical protein